MKDRVAIESHLPKGPPYCYEIMSSPEVGLFYMSRGFKASERDSSKRSEDRSN